MELMLNKTSPYARVARIVALGKGLEARLKLRWVDPWADDPALIEANPSCRVPTLRTEEGRSLSESLLIALYLDRVGEGEALVPPERFAQTLELVGLGQGLIDAAFTTAIARKHQGADADRSVLGRRRLAAIERALTRLDIMAQQEPRSTAFTLGNIVVCVALEYLAFRLPEIPVAERYPALALWHRQRANRPSFRATAFE